MKSKSIILSVAIVALSMISTEAFSQLRFGLKTEVGINKPSFKSEVFQVENMNAFKIGPSAEFMLPIVGLGVDASLLYSNEKMVVKDIAFDKSLLEVSSHYVDVPVNVKYKIGIISPIKAYIAAGPYAQFKIGGDEFKWEQIKSKVEDKKFQAGLNLGFGAEVINRVQVGFNYRLKLTDNYSVDEPQWKDLLNDNKGFWSLSAAVYF